MGQQSSWCPRAQGAPESNNSWCSSQSTIHDVHHDQQFTLQLDIHSPAMASPVNLCDAVHCSSYATIESIQRMVQYTRDPVRLIHVVFIHWSTINGMHRRLDVGDTLYIIVCFRHDQQCMMFGSHDPSTFLLTSPNDVEHIFIDPPNFNSWTMFMHDQLKCYDVHVLIGTINDVHHFRFNNSW